VIRIERDKEWFNNVKDDIKQTWNLITRLQNNPDDFAKYKESLDLLKNKTYYEKFHTTICMIDDNASVIDEHITQALEDTVGDICMIDDSE
jgi:hypothetical protein